jgi:cytoskeletal protein CcmA (bactofilin family)
MKKNGFVEDENITLLARGVELKGEIRVEGTVRIDGLLDGDISTEGTVVVGEDGIVKGTIRAGSLIASGRVKATVHATQKIQLLKPAVLIGEVHTPSLSMEEGAKFQGSCDMGITDWPEDVPRLPDNVLEMVSHHGHTVAMVEQGAQA